MNKFAEKLVVYTALFGAYDRLNPPPKEANNCDFICFSDVEQEVDGWVTVVVDAKNMDPVALNRQYKLLPHKFLERYDASLYIDSNVKIIRDPYPLAQRYLEQALMACPRHFERACIYDEIKACATLGKISVDEANTLTERYIKESFPKQIGLTENHILLRWHNEPAVIETMESWWCEFNNGLRRDQLSLMFVAWKNDFPILFMSESARNNNAYFRYTLHKADASRSFLKAIAAEVRASKDRNFLYKGTSSAIDMIKRLKQRLGC